MDAGRAEKRGEDQHYLYRETHILILFPTFILKQELLTQIFALRLPFSSLMSFPFEMPKQSGNMHKILGDIIIAASVVKQEAAEQNKPIKAHFAHMVVHGTLHILGFDHIEEQEAQQMEQLESQLMHELSFPNPYQETS